MPVRFAFLELRPERPDGAGMRASASNKGIAVIPSIQPGRYELSVEAGGFYNLSRTIEIDGDVDLGRIRMDADQSSLNRTNESALRRPNRRHNTTSSGRLNGWSGKSVGHCALLLQTAIPVHDHRDGRGDIRLNAIENQEALTIMTDGEGRHWRHARFEHRPWLAVREGARRVDR